MIRLFKEMNCPQQIRILLAQWVSLESLIYKERGIPINEAARQKRFTLIFQLILGHDITKYKIESLISEDKLGVSCENVRVAGSAECFKSVANYKVGGMEAIFVFSDECDFVLVENSQTKNLDHAKRLGLIDVPKPSSRFQEGYVKPFKRVMFNLGCKVS